MRRRECPAASAAETSARAAAGDDTAINRDSIGRIIHGLIDEMDDGTGWVRTSRVGDQLIKRYPDFDVRNFGSKSLNKFLTSLAELEVEERIPCQRQPYPVCAGKAGAEAGQKACGPPHRQTHTPPKEIKLAPDTACLGLFAYLCKYSVLTQPYCWSYCTSAQPGALDIVP